MRIAIIGYGKMGKTVEEVAGEQGIEVASTIDPVAKDAKYKEINAESLNGVDVCIDFSLPEAVVGNVESVCRQGKPLVMATTGWQDKRDRVRELVEKSGIGFVHASNFSIGVNLFYRIVGSTARLMDGFDGYDVFGYELHHNRKKDSPSGTALSLGKVVLKNMKRKEKVVTERLDRKIEKGEMHFASVRGGDVPGTHVIGFDSDADTIELKHTARNRKGFALGAIKAGEWVAGKKGFYSIDDFMDEVIGK